MTDEDFEWFEYKYPGWYDKYGKWWENYSRLSIPNGHKPIVGEDVDYVYPNRCWTCMVPCLIREDMVSAEVDGVHRTYCSETCRWTDVEAFRPIYQGRETPNMGRLVGHREWETLYHGWTWAKVVEDMGFVRDDGKTMTAQPHLNLDPQKMWTPTTSSGSARSEPERPVQRDDRRGTGGVRRRLQPPGPGRPAGTQERLSAGQARGRAGRPGPPPRQPAPSPSPIVGGGSVGEKHHVRFEPVGIEIEVDSDQTILRAAAEQGVALMHGCKEGQCASCKSFVLDGEDIELDSYSTFALPDFERDEGSTLLCRAHAFEDLMIELLNYDEEMIQSGLPLRQGTVEVLANEPVTHDMRHLVVKLVEPEEIKYFPGQYLDFQVPGHQATRSFSMANTPNREGVFEFIIRIYPGRAVLRAPRRPDRGRSAAERRGPVRRLPAPREQRRRPAVPRRRGRARAAAGPAALDGRTRHRPEGHLLLRRTNPARSVLRGGDRQARGAVPGLTFVPALSEPAGDDGWEGETGLITDVVERRETNLAAVDAYVCGPPPMVEAAIAMLTRLGRSEDHIFYDKFTTTGEPEGED